MIAKQMQDREFKRARFRSFVKKGPAFNVAATLCMIMQILIFRDIGPWPITIGLPLFIIATAVPWGIWWYQHSDDEFTPAQTEKVMRLSAATCFLVGLSIIVYTRHVFLASSQEMRLFLLLQMVAIGICFYICVLHQKIVAYGVILFLLGPATVMFFSMGDLIGWGGGIVTIALAVFVIVVGRSYEEDMDTLVRSKIQVEQLGAEKAKLANLDMLTQIPNRRHFFDALAEKSQFALEEGSPLCVGIVDLDGFKPINDSYGHRTGDHVLIEVARRLSSCDPRVTDFCRIGGDEFCFIVEETDEDERLIEIGSALRHALRAPIVIGDLQTSVDCSVGFAVRSKDNESGVLLFENADFALYHAKRTGKAQTVIFSANHKLYLESRGVVEQALRMADLENELRAVFQPVVDCVSGKTKGFEALARWHSPKLGMVSPAQFIPVAEQAGLISRITLQMLEKSLTEMRNWPEDIWLSLNLSCHDIISPDTVASLITSIVESGIAPSRISLEITETALLQEFDTAAQHIGQLKAKGIKIALDDFGTGYSSLSHVNTLPLDKLKIDRSFVDKLDSNRNGQNIVRSVISLCRDMGMDCIVEGAETEAEVAVLMQMGCRDIQGYYYARPMPASDIGAFLKDQKSSAEIMSGQNRQDQLLTSDT